jgi:uroporphyrinogen decarboxylase
MTPRERVLTALSFATTDRVPRDLGAMRSTGISAFAYPKLVEWLGLPPRRPRVHDTGQMLALPETDVLDALGCDVVTIDGGVTNAFDEPEKWHDYDFGGRLAARVLAPAAFTTRPDGTVVQAPAQPTAFLGGDAAFSILADGTVVPRQPVQMPPTSYVFDADHGGQPLLDIDRPLPLLDLVQYERALKASEVTDEEVRRTASRARQVRDATDRAVFFTDYCGSGLGIAGHGGLGVFPLICKLEPAYVKEYHEITIAHALRTIRAVLPEVRGCVDIVMTTADDWGTQKTLIASPETYRTLFLPYYRRFNDEVRRLLPGVKVFMHTCGAVYALLDLIVESGFDIVNPVQWPAGGHSYREWKDRVRGRATLWGGGVNAQETLALGTVAEVEREVREVVQYCREDGGYVFNNIHNLLAEVAPERVVAMYRAAH